MSERQFPRSPEEKTTDNHSLASILTLSEQERKLVNWMRREGDCTLAQVTAKVGKDETFAVTLLDSLEQKKLVTKKLVSGEFYYHISLAPRGDRQVPHSLLDGLSKLKFSTLVVLTFITVALLAPFVFSPIYLPILRDNAFATYQFLQGDLYKQITGYTSLVLVLLEMVLTARKRGRSWIINIKVPGKLLLWRSLHVFLGVALLGIVLIHTVGAMGLNFNAVFLWVFFGVTISALVGVTTETGVTESRRRYFGSAPGENSVIPTMKKGPLIRNLRHIWLQSHIWLVSVFCVMLAVHIFLAYYYQ